MNYSLSPLDSRYQNKVSEISAIFSEFGLMKYRTITEIQWLLFLGEKEIAPKIPEESKTKLLLLANNFSNEDFLKIKEFEAVTNHDVKAVEYFIQTQIPQKFWSWIHFACTSEDINNIAYACMIRDGTACVSSFLENRILADLATKAKVWKSIPMLCRTHGQAATPSTVGKELAVFWYRLNEINNSLKNKKNTAKINGATGTFSAHVAAFPALDWISISREFIEQKLELDFSPLTSQIEPHDNQVFVLNELSRISNVLIDLCRDTWGYISLGYFGQRTIKGEVGSSTMPHKVNPIDFENAEGNLKLARGIARTLADELPISRWQRDLTDSTLQRNFGLVFGHFFLALKSLEKGLGKLEIKSEILLQDLKNSPEVLTEAIQTVLRAHGHHDAYEQLKIFSRGQRLGLAQIHEFVNGTNLPTTEKERLLSLLPKDYTGFSERLVEKFVL